VTVPATIMRSDCRGEKRITSAPNLAISKREEAEAMSSMAQQASPIGMGQREFLRIQLTAESKVVRTILPSTLEL
jgi:hypothetical protein